MTNNQLTDGVIDTWFNAAKAAIHHPAPPRKEHSHAFAAYTLAQEVKRLRAELQERRNAAMDSDPVAWMVIDIDTGERIIRCDRSCFEGPCTPLYRHAQPNQEYPETLPCPVILEPGFRFGKGVSTHLVLRALKNRAERYAELDAMGPEARAEHDAAIAELREKLGFGAPAKTAVQIKLPGLSKLGSDAEWYQGFAAGAGSMREACVAALISAGVEIIGEEK